MEKYFLIYIRLFNYITYFMHWLYVPFCVKNMFIWTYYYRNTGWNWKNVFTFDSSFLEEFYYVWPLEVDQIESHK